MSLRILFFDLNSYFASVEQQVNPCLRGRPVAVAAVAADSGCCIATSIEAKRFGVKTGVRVREARRLCPGIAIVAARHGLYVQFHERIKSAVDMVIPIDGVHSIDEFSCVLDPRDREPERAARLAREVKASLRRHIGAWVLASIGIAPNRLLAKTATDMQKPDGLVVIRREDLPEAILGLDLQDLPGIGPRMSVRLRQQGVCSIAALWACSENRLAELWGGVVGRRWWHWLRGHEVQLPPTHRRSIGHQHVLAPALRTEERAWGVAVKLLQKAATRLRHHGCSARRLFLGIGGGHRGWGCDAGLGHGTQDTLELLKVLRLLWEQRPPGPPTFVNVVLEDLILAGSAGLPLFSEEQRRQTLMQVVDRINARHPHRGAILYPASMLPSRDAAPGGIAFATIPNLSLPDAVGRPAEHARPRPVSRGLNPSRRWGAAGQ